MNYEVKPNPLKDKSYAFAVRIVKLARWLRKFHREYELSSQLVRSGTSIGANIREGLYAESKRDFCHKFGIAKKEASETLYWLELLKDSEYLSQEGFNSIYPEGEELLKLLVSIIKQTSNRMDVHN